MLGGSLQPTFSPMAAIDHRSSFPTMAKNHLIKPFLKWAGGKRQLVPEIKAKYLPQRYHTYYEPFIGAGALFLDLRPAWAVINDSNSELINCYLTIRDAVDELIESLRSHQNHSEYYYQMRGWDREPDYAQKSAIERASRIIYLNKTCYNGLFRVNSQGQFNAPFGRYKSPKILNSDLLKAISLYLNTAEVKILNLDFQKAVQTAIKNDFVYFDPPYDPVSATASFTGYDVNGFSRIEQVRLKETFDSLSNRGCHVLLSNSNTDFILDLYKDYRIEIISATRAINSNSQKRGRIDEILVMNY